MALSAAFTVEGASNPAEHTVAYGATVDLAVASLAYNTITWSIVGTSKSDQAAPTITLGGTPNGSTASFPMPSDPGDGLGRSFRVKCVVTDSRGNTATEYAIVGAANEFGGLPGPVGEGATERNATHGYTDFLNSAAAGTAANQRVRLHDTTHTPAGLWQFNEVLTDSSGNGRTLSLTAGAERYTEIYPGLKALYLASASKLQFATTGTPLQRTGDITIEFLLVLYAVGTGIWVTYDGNSETQANNTLYQVGITTDQLTWLQEDGAGTDRSYSSARLPPVGEICHLACRRQSNVIQYFMNGKPFGTASSSLTTPDGGTTSFLRIGSATVSPPTSAIASLKIVLSALSDAQILAEYNRCLGGALGVIV